MDSNIITFFASAGVLGIALSLGILILYIVNRVIFPKMGNTVSESDFAEVEILLKALSKKITKIKGRLLFK